MHPAALLKPKVDDSPISLKRKKKKRPLGGQVNVEMGQKINPRRAKKIRRSQASTTFLARNQAY